MLEKARMAVNGLLKGILMKAEKDKRRAVEQVSVFLEHSEVTPNRMWVEIRMVRATLMSSQTEMRDMLLETGGKVMLMTKWHRAWLDCVCVLVFCGRENLQAMKLGF